MIDKMSWSFIPEGMHFDSKTRTVTYSGIKKIFDVSAVSIPANDTTDIHVKSFVDGEITKAMQELHRREAEILRLKIKAILGGM